MVVGMLVIIAIVAVSCYLISKPKCEAEVVEVNNEVDVTPTPTVTPTLEVKKEEVVVEKEKVTKKKKTSKKKKAPKKKGEKWVAKSAIKIANAASVEVEHAV